MITIRTDLGPTGDGVGIICEEKETALVQKMLERLGVPTQDIVHVPLAFDRVCITSQRENDRLFTLMDCGTCTGPCRGL